MINIQIDSRLVKPGDIFVAIEGTIYDGHKFIDNAIRNGAKKVVVSNKKTYSVKTINVDNTYEYLQDYLIKNYAKEFKNMKIIGVTGTNGKTTTAYMTYEFLKKIKVKCAYIGTIGFFYNNKEISTANTTPDILSLYKCLLEAKEAGCKVVILEASSIGLKQGRLDGISFDGAVFTNLSHEHLDHHKTMNEYMRAKRILCEHLKPNGCSVVNIDNNYAKYFTMFPNPITFGFDDNANIECVKTDKLYKNFTFRIGNAKYDITSPLIGKFNVYNMLASISILYKLGISVDQMLKVFPTLGLPKGRMNIIDYKSNKIVIDYAHTPDAVKQVLETSSLLTTGKTYVVFGCPGNRDRTIRPMIGKLVYRGSDYFIVTDDDPHYESEEQIVNDITSNLKHDKFEIETNRKKAISKAIDLLNENDTLLILGKGHENYIVIRDKKIIHNDYDYVMSVLKNKKDNE